MITDGAARDLGRVTGKCGRHYLNVRVRELTGNL
jgi:hypothetical protein